MKRNPVGRQSFIIVPPWIVPGSLVLIVFTLGWPADLFDFFKGLDALTKVVWGETDKRNI